MAGQFDRWQGLQVPSLAEIEALVAKAYAGLPEHFRALCDDLIFRIEDFPDREVLETNACRERIRPARAISGRRPAVPVIFRAATNAQYDLALTAARSSIIGRNTTTPWATS